jgi:hypothetical protein
LLRKPRHHFGGTSIRWEDGIEDVTHGAVSITSDMRLRSVIPLVSKGRRLIPFASSSFSSASSGNER